MSSFQVFGLPLVAMLVFCITSTVAQDRNTYRPNDAQVIIPVARQARATTVPTYQVNGASINKYLLNENEVETIKPYEFGFKMNDGNGTTQHRQEIRLENGDIRGTYGYLDPTGTYREVEYYTDANGYHAKVKSNEPGLSNKNSANVVYVIENPPKAAVLAQPRPIILVPNSVA